MNFAAKHHRSALTAVRYAGQVPACVAHGVDTVGTPSVTRIAAPVTSIGTSQRSLGNRVALIALCQMLAATHPRLTIPLFAVVATV